MVILLSCLQDLRSHDIPSYRYWQRYFKNGILEAGHECLEVPEVDWAEATTGLSAENHRAWADKTWSKTIAFITAQTGSGRKIDLFLSYLYPAQVEESAIQEIRRQGIPCVNFFCDNVREFTRVPPEYRLFDLHWVPEWEALEMYARAALKTCFAPMPCWVPKEAREPAVAENGQVTFIGSSDELRRSLLGGALQKGAPIMIGGAGWHGTGSGAHVRRSVPQLLKNQFDFLRERGVSQWLRKSFRRIGRPSLSPIPEEHILPTIDNTNYIRLTKESTVTLGVNRVPSFRRSRRNPLVYSRLRDIEAPMLGACYLTEYAEDLTHFYELGEEIETYRGTDELVEKIRALKADKSKRDAMRRLGQRRALNDLSVGRSLEKLCKALGLPNQVLRS
jgi:hypothetical protein